MTNTIAQGTARNESPWNRPPQINLAATIISVVLACVTLGPTLYRAVDLLSQRAVFIDLDRRTVLIPGVR
jgi:hypothetical protein